MPFSESACEEGLVEPGPLVLGGEGLDCEPTLERPPEPEEDEPEELLLELEEDELGEPEPPKLEEELEKRS